VIWGKSHSKVNVIIWLFFRNAILFFILVWSLFIIFWRFKFFNSRLGCLITMWIIFIFLFLKKVIFIRFFFIVFFFLLLFYFIFVLKFLNIILNFVSKSFFIVITALTAWIVSSNIFFTKLFFTIIKLSIHKKIIRALLTKDILLLPIIRNFLIDPIERKMSIRNLLFRIF
jgi:hypothetical protein